MVNFSLEGKTALVTGASYGIGFAIATAFAEAGATIVFNDIRQELVDKGLAAYREKGIQAHGYVCDVTDEEAVKAFIARVGQEVGTIDILVNNAGIIKRIPMCEMSAAEFRQVIDVDLNAPFIVSKAVIPGMIRKGHGKIINICSMMSELGRETVSAYAAAKGGLKMLTRNIASEYGEYNIIRKMVSDLNFDIEIVGCPIIREEDGLAKSSRNTYLSPEERKAALCLSKAVKAGQEAIHAGIPAEELLGKMRAVIEAEPLAKIDYVSMVDALTMQPVEKADRSVLVAMAVYIGKTRLIDNFSYEV